VPEFAGSPLTTPETCSNVSPTISRGPFKRFSRLGYVDYAHDVAYYQVAKPIWRQLAEVGERTRVEELCHRSIEAYYRRG